MNVHENKLRLSYASEPGDVLSDLGDGKVLISHPGRVDRILDRKTGVITERPYSEWHKLGGDILKVLAFFTVGAVSLIVYYLVQS